MSKCKGGKGRHVTRSANGDLIGGCPEPGCCWRGKQADFPRHQLKKHHSVKYLSVTFSNRVPQLR